MIWTAQTEATEAETSVLWQAFEQLRTAGVDAGVRAFEAFVETHPASGWTPSLRLKLARYYRLNGRLSRTLAHCEAAWGAVALANVSPVRTLADEVFLLWSQTLADLGRTDELGALFELAGDRHPATLHVRRAFDDVKRKHGEMQSRVAGLRHFKCGVLAVAQVAFAQTLRADPCEVLDVAAPPEGFSLADLIRHARRLRMELVPVRRVAGTELVAPSILHWKLQHYSAILGHTNGLYQVADRVLGGLRWLSADAINEEASGYFLVQAGTPLPPGWMPLQSAEAKAVFGKGGDDYNPLASPPPCEVIGTACPFCRVGGPSFSGGAPGGCIHGLGCGAGGGPPSFWAGLGSADPTPYPVFEESYVPLDAMADGGSRGMPRWFVDEPYISLWLLDEPMSYQPSRGREVNLRITYHQRESRPFSEAIFSLGPEWNMNHLSYVGYGDYGLVVYAPGGGEQRYANTPWGVVPDDWSCSAIITNPPGYKIVYPDGTWTEYHLLMASGIGETNAFMTKRVNPSGHALGYYYSTNNNAVRLTAFVDVDGRTNQLQYDATFTNQVASIQNPLGQTATFQYDQNGYLTNITDVVGLSSSFAYSNVSSTILLTKLTTPYGETSFEYVDPSACLCLGEKRAIHVQEPNGARHLYLYVDNCTTFLPYSYPDAPTGVPVKNNDNKEGSPDGSCNHNMYFRNSFYWGPNHYGLLSTNEIALLTTNDYRISRMRNWLHDRDAGVYERAVSGTINMERGASPNGVTEGAKTWYGYTGKGAGSWNWEGDNPRPSWIAVALPDGQTRYTYKEYNAWGQVTLEATTNLLGSTYQGVTNRYTYAENGIDLLYVTNQAGVRTHAYTYNNDHQVLTATDALGWSTTYTYDEDGWLTSVETPSELLTTNLYDANGWLSKTIDREINRTNTYTWTNGLVHTHTDERGLTITNTWDALGRLTQVAYPDGTTSQYRYDKLDLVEIVDRLGHTNSFGYNPMRQKVWEQDAEGRITGYFYCDCGSLDYTTNALNQTNHFYYDDLGRLQWTHFADGSWRTNTYDAVGQLIAVSDAQGATTNYYNLQGLLTVVSNAYGRVQQILYDEDGRATNTVDANGVVLRQTFDAAGRLRTRTYPDGGVERFGYASEGLVAYTNQLDQVTRYGYDEAGRKRWKGNANLETNRFTYNAAGDLLTLTDGNGQVTTWWYDAYGRVAAKIDANEDIVAMYTYDPAGRLTNRWSAAKGNTRYTYDAVGNLTNVDYATSPDLQLAYDGLNHLTNLVDAVGSTRYSYTTLGQLLSEDGPWDDDTVSYSYANRVRSSLSLAQPGAGAWTQSYAYDAMRRLTNTTSPAGAFAYTYTGVGGVSGPGGLVRKLTLPMGAYITNEFNVAGRWRKTLLASAQEATLGSTRCGYNAAGQRTAIYRDENTPNDAWINYEYDAIGQLRWTTDDTQERRHEHFGYACDAAHNLRYWTNGALMMTFTVDALNQLTNVAATGNLTVAGFTTAAATNVTVNGCGDGIRGPDVPPPNQRRRSDKRMRMWKFRASDDETQQRNVVSGPVYSVLATQANDECLYFVT